MNIGTKGIVLLFQINLAAGTTRFPERSLGNPGREKQLFRHSKWCVHFVDKKKITILS